MKNFLKIFDKYGVCLWAIVIMLVVNITMLPFTYNYIKLGLIEIPVTPLLIMLPILMGVVYAIFVSYEDPEKKGRKEAFRVWKFVSFLLFYILDILVFVYAAVNGNIRF